jgi:hypothetical protein
MVSWVPRPGLQAALLAVLGLVFTPPASAESKEIKALHQEIQV